MELNGKEFLGHPRGLLVCALTEMWEFFSYFGMRAILIFYLTQGLGLPESQSYAVYGAFIGLTWALPILGGTVADQIIGRRKAIIAGAIAMATGYALLAINEGIFGRVVPSGLLTHSKWRFYGLCGSLGIVLAGAGLLKSNITTLVGALYDTSDTKRDTGYTMFYFAANIGGAAAPIVCGWLGQHWGWAWGFGASSLGMIVGLVAFITGDKYLPLSDKLSRPPRYVQTTDRFNLLIGLAVLAAGVALGSLVARNELLGMGLTVFASGAAGLLVFWTVARCSPIERWHMIAIIAVSSIAVLFFAFYEQMGSSLNLFMDRFVDLTVGGHHLEASQMISLAAIFALILAPAFGALWTWLGHSGRNPHDVSKLAAGLAFLGLAFAAPVLGAHHSAARMSILWPVLMFFLMECAEVCTVPITFALVSALSPRRYAGAMMGCYFLCVALGSFLAGRLAATTTSIAPAALASASPTVGAYGHFSVVLLSAACIVLLVWRVLRSAMPYMRQRIVAAGFSTDG